MRKLSVEEVLNKRDPPTHIVRLRPSAGHGGLNGRMTAFYLKIQKSGQAVRLQKAIAN
tara:strand:- start:251 stop:424 length:174 start_codon:yes stop_codon:yes gene_type:complete